MLLDLMLRIVRKSRSRWPPAARRGRSAPRSSSLSPPDGVVKRAVESGVVQTGPLSLRALLTTIAVMLGILTGADPPILVQDRLTTARPYGVCVCVWLGQLTLRRDSVDCPLGAPTAPRSAPGTSERGPCRRRSDRFTSLGGSPPSLFALGDACRVCLVAPRPPPCFGPSAQESTSGAWCCTGCCAKVRRALSAQ